MPMSRRGQDRSAAPDGPSSRVPPEVSDAVRELCGPGPRTTALSGMSGRSVVRVSGPAGDVVVKGPAHPREGDFYRRFASAVRAGGLAVPRVHLVRDSPEGPWLVLDHVPGALPPSRWLADPAVLDGLAALHGRADALAGLTHPFRPEWTAGQTEAALARLPAGHRAAAGVVLRDWQDEAEPWLTGSTPVSGDPNPRNWGVDGTGRVVLFDWERAGLATAALDLAITVPGLPTIEDVARVVDGYGSALVRTGAALLTGTAALERGVQLCKAWTVVELLATDPTANPELAATQAWVASVLPDWLDRGKGWGHGR